MDFGEARYFIGRQLNAPHIPGIVLAAGAGRRCGSQKLLWELKGQAVIYHALRAALEAPLEPVYLVLGCDSNKVLTALAELRDAPKLRILHNRRWASGRASSLQLGLRSLPDHAPGAVILLGDMPLMTSGLIARVAKNFQATKKLCFPLYRGEIGRPVALPRALFAKFCKLQGDESGLAILKAHWDEAAKLELSPAAASTQLDLDTPDDRVVMKKALSV